MSKQSSPGTVQLWHCRGCGNLLAKAGAGAGPVTIRCPKCHRDNVFT